MEKNLLAILEACNLAYSNGEVYELTTTDKGVIHDTLKVHCANAKVSDVVYDILYYAAKDKWPNDPFFAALTSVDVGVGTDVIHDEPMGSMDELKSGDWDKFKVRNSGTSFVGSDKLDGCSVILKYVKGKLFSAATRGRGVKGKCIRRHVENLKSVPQTIPQQDTLIVRGELLCPKVSIDKMLEERELETGNPQKNGRNTVAGALNKKETSNAVFSRVEFVAYWDSESRGRDFFTLEESGFTIPFLFYCTPEWTESQLVEVVESRMKNSRFELDGIIITQVDNSEDGFETGTINPKQSRKFKLGISGNEAESVVTGITWQISKDYKFTPVLEIEPRDVSGATISRITGHNYQNVVEKRCGVGSTIKFVRSGLVIPYLTEVTTPSDDFALPDVPTEVVGKFLMLAESEQGQLNDFSTESDIQALVHFGKKLDVPFLGYGNCKKLYFAAMGSLNMVITPYMIYGLPKGFISEALGENGKKIEIALEELKCTLTEPKFAAACGIFGPSMGERILNNVFKAFNTLNVTREQLSTLEGFAEARIEQYLHYLASWLEVREVVARVNITFVETAKPVSEEFAGYVVCFSGIRDKDLEVSITEKGGEVASGWKSTVTHLVVKDPSSTSSKLINATKNGSVILGIDEAKILFGEN